MAIHGSVRTLLAGGREPDLGLMTIYVFIALAAIIVVWLIIRNYSKKANSDMLKAEELAWFINSLITGAIGAAFLITFLFRMTSLHWVERYVDQVLVICLGVFLIKDPFVIIRNGLKELLLAAPADDYVTPIRERVLDLAEDYKLKGVLVEAIKTGRKFWITIRADPGIESVTTDDVENFRKEAITRIKELYDTIDLEIIIQKIPRNR
jgi:predicted Co/Zn/Cd cation transporter (cation efflux family)